MHTTYLWTDIVCCARAEPQKRGKQNSSYRANDGDDVSGAKRNLRLSLQGAGSGMHDEHLQKSSKAFNMRPAATKQRKAADARQHKMLHDSVQFEASQAHGIRKKRKAELIPQARDTKERPKHRARQRSTGKGLEADISRGTGEEAHMSQDDDAELDDEEDLEQVRKRLKPQFTTEARDSKPARNPPTPRRSRGKGQEAGISKEDYAQLEDEEHFQAPKPRARRHSIGKGKAANISRRQGKEADMCEQDDAELVDEEHLQVEEQHVRLRTSRLRRRAVGARPKELVAMEEEASAVDETDGEDFAYDDGRRGGAASHSGKGSRKTGARGGSQDMRDAPSGQKAYKPSPLRTHAGTQSPHKIVSSGDDVSTMDASEGNDSADDDTGSSANVIRLPKTVTLDPLFGPCAEGQINMDFGTSLGSHGNWVCASVGNTVMYNAHAVPEKRTVWQHKILSPGRSTCTEWGSHQVSPTVEDRIARTVLRFNRKYPCATIQGVLPLSEVVPSKVSSVAHAYRPCMHDVNACLPVRKFDDSWRVCVLVGRW